MAKVEKSFEAVCDFMAHEHFLEACSRELFVHLELKAFENLMKTPKQKRSVDTHKAEKGKWDRMPKSCLDHWIHP